MNTIIAVYCVTLHLATQAKTRAPPRESRLSISHRSVLRHALPQNRHSLAAPGPCGRGRFTQSSDVAGVLLNLLDVEDLNLRALTEDKLRGAGIVGGVGVVAGLVEERLRALVLVAAGLLVDGLDVGNGDAHGN